MTNLRALLLTDIVDSTGLCETVGDAAMADLMGRHDRMARDLLPRWRGREIDRTDGMLLLFSAAADAVEYALSYQEALEAIDPRLRARAAIHVGALVMRENSAEDVRLGAKPFELDGIAKAVTARLMSMAGGGQTLLSAAARTDLGPTRLRLQSHGHWRMQGVLEPEEIFEVGRGKDPFTPPVGGPKVYRVIRHGDLWLPVAGIEHSLRAERDSFVGRKDALDDLASRFNRGARLVSVLGMGGTGKTRLSLRFAWSWLGDFPGGAWFCDLSHARDADGIVQATAQALAVQLGKDEPIVQLCHAIAARGRCLLILDNFEQVARHAEATLGRWLDGAHSASFLVTSREVLGIAGEQVLALPPLPASDAKMLFMQRAESARRGFLGNGTDDQAIESLVALLDGSPLAVELAAARVRLMSPRTLVSRMSERFTLLASMGGRLDRQATLRATFDWSWELLAAHEKAALAQLSVFEGGFTLRAAEAVLDLSAFDGAVSALDAVQSLVDKSFLTSAADRLWLSSSVRDYAAEHLRTPGRYPGSGVEAVRAAQAAHASHYATLSELEATGQGGVELDNLIAACRSAVGRHDAAVAVAALENAWAALRLRGPFRFGIELVGPVRALCAADAASMARVERIAGASLMAMGRVAEARARFEDALDAARRSGDRRTEGRILNELGALHADEGRIEEARFHQAAAWSLARELGDLAFEYEVRKCLGTLEEHLGRLDDASTHYHATLHLARQLGSRRLEGGALGNIGLLLASRGDMEGARAHLESALSIARQVGDRRWEGNTLSNLGMLHFMQGRSTEATDPLEAALTLARQLGHRRLECYGYGNLGMVHEDLGRRAEALEHYEKAVTLARELGDRRVEGQFLSYLGMLHAREQRFDEARDCLDEGETLLTLVSDTLSLGILLCNRAETEHLAGDEAAAAAAYEAAKRQAAGVSAGPESELGRSMRRVADLLQDVVPAPAK